MNVKCLAVALLCTAVFGFVSAAPVKVVNPGLEEGAKGWQLAGRPDWSVAENVGRGGGRGLLRSGSVTSSYQVVGLPLDLKPGHRYRVSVWAKSIDLTDGKRPGVCVEWNDRWKGGYLGGVGPTRRSVSEPDAEGWRKYEMDTWMIPANAVGCALHLFAPKLTGGRCVYDDVTVEEIGVAAQELTSSAAFNRAATGKVQFLIRTYPDFGACPYEDLEPVFTYQTEQGPRTVRSREFRDGVASTVVDVSELKMGTHPVTFSIGVRGKGEMSAWKLDFTRLRPEEAKPGRVHFDAHQRLIVDGKPFFPLGVYWSDVSKNHRMLNLGGVKAADLDPRQFPAVERSPFNFVLSYNQGVTPEYLDEFDRRGLKVIAALCSVWHDIVPWFGAFVHTPEEERSYLENLVGSVRNHPALLGWYLYDEPEEKVFARVRERDEFIKRLDPDHPTVVCINRPANALPSLGLADFHVYDVYPVPGSGTEKTKPADLARTWRGLDHARTATGGIKPIWGVPQAYPHEPERARFPTVHEMRAMAWQMIAGGANGLLFYSIGEQLAVKEKPGYSFDEAWKITCETAADVKRWERVLLSDEPAPAVSDVPKTLAARAWRLEGKTYLLVCNLTHEPVQGTVSVDGKKIAVSLGGDDVEMKELAEAKEWPGFSRGMGIGGWLTNYKRFNVLPVDKRLTLTDGDFAHFDTYITEGDVARIKKWGFDHIRLGFDQIVLEEKPGVWRERTFRKIEEFIGWCGKHKVNVVLNLHKAIGNYCDIPEKTQLLDDDELQDRFVALWLEMERRVANGQDARSTSTVAFEILNEVRDVDPAKWNALADRTLKAIREKNPDRWVVIGSTCWNHPAKLKELQVWDDPKVVYTFHMYMPHGFTHQRGVLQAGPLFENAEVPYPGRAAVEELLRPAAEWAKAHPDKILWNGEFGTIRHMQPIARADYMRDVIGFCRRHGIPYCVWNYLSTPNDGNRFSLVDDDTRDFLSDELYKACLGEGDAEARGELTYMCYNLWGNYFGNPVFERDLKQAAYVLRHAPDVVGVQEAMPEFWSSRLFPKLAAEYGVVRSGTDPNAEYNPILYRKRRLELIEGGTHVYDYKDNPEKSKGFGWAVLRDKATGRRFISYSTHLWWMSKPLEKQPAYDRMRVNNVRELLAKMAELKKKYGELPVIGGGDLNTTENIRLSGRECPLNDWLAAGYCDAQYSVPGASPWSSNHGDPKRDALGFLRGYIRPEAGDPKNSLDHVHYTQASVNPLSLVVDRAQDALECSDHSPVIFTFTLK